MELLRLYALIDPAEEAQLLAKRETLEALLTLRATVFEAIEKVERELFLRNASEKVASDPTKLSGPG